MSGKIGRNGIDLFLDPFQPGFNTVQPGINAIQSRFDPVQPSPQIGFNPVDLVVKHLIPFNYDIQLVLKIFGYYSRLMLDLALEVFGHHADMALENFLYLPDLISVHKISRQVSFVTQASSCI